MPKFKFKTTLILVVIFFGLLAFVYFYESKRPTKKEENETGIEKIEVWKFNKDEITELNITNEDGQFLIVRKNDKWQVKKPSEFEAKNEEIDKILNNLSTLTAEKEIQPENLSDFGLDSSKIRASLKFKNGLTKELLIGNENPVGTMVYIKVSDRDKVFLVSNTLKDDLNFKEEKLKPSK